MEWFAISGVLSERPDIRNEDTLLGFSVKVVVY